MIEKFLSKLTYSSYDDFMRNFKIEVPEHFNFGYDIIDEWARVAPEKEAILWTDGMGNVKRVTYRELSETSDRVAAYLMSLGITKEDRVMLILKRHIEWWYIMVALHKIGAIAIPSSYLLQSHDILFRIHEARIGTIITCGEEPFISTVSKVYELSDELDNCISIGPMVAEGWLDFWEGVNNAPEFVRPDYEIRNDDRMMIYFTSGTSAMPKMVVHDFQYPLTHILTGHIWQSLSEQSRQLTLTDTGWAMCIWGQFYSQMLCGATVVLYDFPEKFNAARLLKVMADFKVTTFFAPPTVYRFLLKEDWTPYDLSSLEYCTVAGEPLYPAIFYEWEKRTGGIRMKECFGQTETPLVVGVYPWCESKPGSMGLPNPQIPVELLNDNDEPCAPNETGHLVIRLDKGRPLGLFKEYYLNPKLTSKTHDGAYYDTGDMAYRDEDGYYWYVSRSDDVIKSSGYRISPFEVESTLIMHPAIQEVAVTAVPDEIRGQVVKASIVVKPEFHDYVYGMDRRRVEKHLQDFVKKMTAPYKYPRVIELVDELPKTFNGKIRRAAIRKKDAKKK